MKHFPIFLLLLTLGCAFFSTLTGCNRTAAANTSSNIPERSSEPCENCTALANSSSKTTIAVATNFHHVAQSLSTAYMASQPLSRAHQIEIVAGSSGKLLTQIKNGAPFDIFLSADQKRAQIAEEAGFGVANARYTYAHGQLVLWSKNKTALPSNKEHLTAALMHTRIAIANPSLAPYGRAAVEALAFSGLKENDLNLIYGENVGQAFGFAATGQTDFALTSLSMALYYEHQNPLTQSGYIVLPTAWHQPVIQQAVLLKRAVNNNAAQGFWTFLKSRTAQHIIEEAGYSSFKPDPFLFEGGAPLIRSEPQIRTWINSLGPLWLSIQLATWTTFILFCLGTPLAWWLATSRSRAKPFIEAATALPLVLPPTVLGFYLLIAFNPNAPLGAGWVSLTGTSLTFSFTGLVFASVLYSLPFMVQPLQASFQNIGPAPMEAAASLRAGPIDRFFSVMAPMAKRGFLTGGILSFTHTIGEFGVILMVGGNIPTETKVISIAIYEHVETLNYAEANRLAIILLIFSFITLLSVYTINRQAIIHGR